MLGSLARRLGLVSFALVAGIVPGEASDARVAAPDVPVAATVVDLGRDGVQQLLVGWRAHAGGRLEWRPVAPQPGESDSRFAALPVTPDILATGDFDADGRLDVIVAARGDAAVWYLFNDGHGGFGSPLRAALPGRLTAAVAGDVNRLDGLADLVVAVDAGAGASLLVFEDPHGAKNAAAERTPLPAPASDLVIAMLDDDGFADVAAACGAELVVVGGRDRMLGIGRLETPAANPATRIVAAPFPIAALVAGRFGSAVASPARLAIAGTDGRVAVSTPSGEWRPPTGSARTFPAGVRLLRAKVTPRAGDDLLVFDPSSGSVSILATESSESAASGNGGLVDQLEFAADTRVVVPVRSGASALEELRGVGAAGITSVRGTNAVASLFVVNDPGDAPDAWAGDGVCDTGTGVCTLHAAIQEANAFPGADSIRFSLGSGNPAVILATPLPVIDEAVTIDGATGGATRVVLSGASLGAGISGIHLGSGSNGSAIRSFVIHGFAAAGILIDGADNVIEGCYIGTDATGGTGASGNRDGVVLMSASANGNTIGGNTPSQRNVISHNTEYGVKVTASAAPNVISGNYIGVDPSGSTAVPNGDAAVYIDEATANTVWIGGSVATPGTGLGNVLVAPNLSRAIRIIGGSGDVIQGNVIGIDATGTSVLGEGRVSLISGTNATLGGSTVSERNVLRGVEIGCTFGLVCGTARIQGNYVGTDIDGHASLDGSGISVTDGRTGVVVGGNAATFGAPPGNVISGSTYYPGVSVIQGSNHNPTQASVLGNIIGLDATGKTKLPNSGGVDAGSRGSVTLGGENPGDGNLISGNNGDGVRIPGGSVTAKGNWIGPDLAGTKELGNTVNGVSLSEGGAGGTSASATIGGVNAGAGNVISGNGNHGIFSNSPSSSVPSVLGNRIGVGPDGVLKMGNGASGIAISNSGGNTSIGGTTGLTPGACTGACNLIANNGLDGVSISSAFYGLIPVRGNVFRSNGDLGIDLDGNGPTPNDPGDGDNGSNRLQNFPVITSRAYDGVETTIQGTLNSAANTTYDLDVYANTTRDPSGYGEGEIWLGSATCATDASGSCSWSFVAPGARDFLAATATSPDGATSEISRVYSDDLDSDGVPNTSDNCIEVANPHQTDTDADGLGNLCDNCAGATNASQLDSDADGAGDACDCQPLDSTDRRPREVPISLRKSLTNPNETWIDWGGVDETDRFSVSRGDLATLSATKFGMCVGEGLTTYSDATVPAPGHGFFYLVAGQNFDCGLGSWGKMSNEAERVNTDPAACGGAAFADVHATSQSTVYGTVSGTLANTQSSNNLYESLTEVLSTGGSAASKFSRLEQRWSFSVGIGLKDLHVEGFRSASVDGDNFQFECSTNASTWATLSWWNQPLSDNNFDQSFGVGSCVTSGFSGFLYIRLVDTDRTAGNQALDTVTIDELFVRVVP